MHKSGKLLTVLGVIIYCISAGCADVSAVSKVKDVDSSLVGYWSFDDGTATDLSIYNHHGVIDGTTQIASECNFGMLFDGIDDIVLIDHSNHFNIENDITIEAHVNVSDSSPAEPIISKGSTSGTYSFYVGINNGWLSFQLGGVDGFFDICPIYTNEWYHIAALRKGDFAIIYINGVKIDSMSFGGSCIRTNDVAITIAKYNGFFFKGIIDEVRIYNRALDGTEIYEHATSCNHPPVLEDIGPQNIMELDTLIVNISATDQDNDDIQLFAEYLPSNTLFIDSGNGHALFEFFPDYNQSGSYEVLFIASDGILSDSEYVEIYVTDIALEIGDIFINGQSTPIHLLNHNPVIEWIYIDPTGNNPQVQFEIAVGIDDDWQYAEMWNPAPFESSDTSIVYNGSPLIDGETYYLRLRVYNGQVWSEWYETSFRMNSLPSIPLALQPIDDDICTTTQPTLYLSNSFDAEGDTLVYDFVAAVDTAFGEPELYQGENIPEGEDSTGWQIDEPLHENWHYWWKARAFDGYEYSDWSESEMFWINAVEEIPDTFRVYYPPDTSSGIVYDMLPDFIWSGSHDNDPFDSVHYSLYLSTDSEFVFFSQVDSIWEPYYALTDSLYFGTKFYWKAKAVDNTGQFTYSNNVLSFRTWKLGDASGDWEVNLLDILALIDCLYGEGYCPDPVIASDVNGDCSVNLLDVLYLISYLYGNPPGSAPVVGCE